MTKKTGIRDKEEKLRQEPGAVVLKELEVRAAQVGERDRVRELLGEEHYPGAGREVGRTLVQVVHHRGRWVALLVWGPAAMKLVDREKMIGWTEQQRAQRLGLVVQNRRLLVLSETRMPNLASRALGLALKELAGHWEQKHGYKPVLAETFTDIESFEGTCYKAAGWEPCGMSKGFGREHRSDFYREHKRPKKLWLKPLSRNMRTILCAVDVPANYRAGVNAQTPERALPLKKAQIVLTLAFSEHETGAPVAMTIASKEPKTEKAKTEGELTAAKRLYQSTDIQGATITADALHGERESMHLVVENGGDFLFQLKNNQPTALKEAEKIAASASPLLPATR